MRGQERPPTRARQTAPLDRERAQYLVSSRSTQASTATWTSNKGWPDDERNVTLGPRRPQDTNVVTPSSVDASVLRRYLLGQLSEPERERLEERYFDDDEVFAALVAAEEELTSDYLAGTLSEQRPRAVRAGIAHDPGRA